MIPPAAPPTLWYDARSVEPGMSGVGRFALSLLGALARRPDRPPIRALFRSDTLALARQDPTLQGVELAEAPWAHTAHPGGDWWLHRTLPRQMAPGDLFLGPAFLCPIGGGGRVGKLVVIHDLFVFTHPQFFPWKFGAWLRWSIRQSCRRAGCILVPTATVGRQLVQRGLAPAEKIVTVGEAPDASHAVWDRPTPNAQRPAPGLARLLEEAEAAADTTAKPPLVLTVGTLDPRKDPATARRAHLMLRERPEGRLAGWLWAGGPGPVPEGSPAGLVERSAAADFMTPGHVPGPQVATLMRRATVYVTCSHTEGFGIPLVEAMRAGVPIVASDIAVHREVAGPAALYFSPGDPAALADLLDGLLTDSARLEALRTAGQERSTQFSWELTARKVLQNLPCSPAR